MHLPCAVGHVTSVSGGQPTAVNGHYVPPSRGNGDPMMTGFDARAFEFMGEPGLHYNLLSEQRHQVIHPCLHPSPALCLHRALQPADFLAHHLQAEGRPPCTALMLGIMAPAVYAKVGGQERRRADSDMCEQVTTKLKLGVMWDHNGTYMEGYGFQYRDQQVHVELDENDEIAGAAPAAYRYMS